MPFPMNPTFITYLWVAIGSALGGMARQYCGVMAARFWGAEFPWGTIGINILGSFVIGTFAALTDSTGRYPLGGLARQFVMVGICGGYTTFSSFSLQSLMLMRDGRWLEAGANVLLSVTLCLVAVALGHILAVQLS
jgi:CrcB protein